MLLKWWWFRWHMSSSKNGKWSSEFKSEMSRLILTRWWASLPIEKWITKESREIDYGSCITPSSYLWNRNNLLGRIICTRETGIELAHFRRFRFFSNILTFQKTFSPCKAVFFGFPNPDKKWETPGPSSNFLISSPIPRFYLFPFFSRWWWKHWIHLKIKWIWLEKRLEFSPLFSSPFLLQNSNFVSSDDVELHSALRFHEVKF